MGQSPEAGLPHAGPAAVRAGSPSGADVACSRRGSGGRSAPAPAPAAVRGLTAVEPAPPGPPLAGGRSICAPGSSGGRTQPRRLPVAVPEGQPRTPGWLRSREPLAGALAGRRCARAPPGSRSGRGRPFSWRPSRSFARGWEIPSRSVGGLGYSGRISGTACCPAWARLAREVALGLLETTGDEAGTAASARLPGAAAAGDPASRPHSSASAAHQRGACWQNRRFLVSRAGVRSPRLVCAWAPRRRAEPACAPLGSLPGS